MSARECPACHGRGGEDVYMRDYGYEGESQWGACDTCDGTGKVWPSVEGEIVVEANAQPYTGKTGTTWAADFGEVGMLAVSGPGRHRVIVQKIGEEKP